MQISRSGLLFWLSTALAAVLLILVCVNIVITSGNRGLQVEVNSRQQFINQSIQLSRLHQELVTALATVSVKNNNEAIRQILADVGIMVSASSSTTAAPAAASPAASAPAAAPKTQTPAH